jgi:enediyne biosynthesis protein E4
MVFRFRWIGVSGLALACTSPLVPSGHPVQLGEEVICESDSKAEQVHFEELAVAHGIVRRVGTSQERSFPLDAGVAAVDADLDGDEDLFFTVESEFPQVFENDGSGNFSEVTQSVVLTSTEAASLLGFALVDFDGDGLLDVLLFGPRSVVVSENQGGLSFGPLRTVFEDSAPEVGLAVSAAFGDVDQDGDLDVFLPGLDPVGFGPPSEVGSVPSLDRLLVRENASLQRGPLLQTQSGPGLSMVALFSDREGDGDQDLLVPSLRGAFGMSPTAFYRNTGANDLGDRFQDDASAVHADLPVSGMGIDSADLNGDGQMDYCISDLNRMQCLLSSDSGTFTESAQSLGLVLPAMESEKGWSGWSVDFVDLDNDDALDLVAAGGMPLNNVGDGLDYAESRNLVWWGGSEGFEPAKEQIFHGLRGYYGMVSADLDNNGMMDFVFAGSGGAVEAFFTTCRSASWTDIRLAGPVGNTQGLGARVFVRANGLRHARQIQGLRGLAQGPSQAHFGLGEAESIGKLTVVWPDGNITISRDLPINRSIRVPHPDRLFGYGETGASEDSGEEE